MTSVQSGVKEAVERVRQMIVDCEAEPDLPLMVDAYICAEHAADLRTLLAALSSQAEEIDGLRDELGRVSLGLGPDVRFMDPPDGGSVRLGKQVNRMRVTLELTEDAAEAMAKGLEAVTGWDRLYDAFPYPLALQIVKALDQYRSLNGDA